MPAIDGASDTCMLCNSIRRGTDVCEIFSVHIDTEKSRNIAIGDIATLASMALSRPDRRAKPGYSLYARDTSVRSIHYGQ